jgi:hypothetical protein
MGDLESMDRKPLGKIIVNKSKILVDIAIWS